VSALRWVQIARAPASLLWEICATPEGLARWQADRVTGDIRPGGTIELEWPDLGARTELQVVDVVPGRRLTLSDRQSRVIAAVEDGSVILSHEGPTMSDVEGLASSWRSALAVLAHAVEQHPGRDRTVRWSVHPAPTTAATVHALFTDPAGLAQWLGASAGFGPAGSSWSATADGQPLTGRVLSNIPGRDVVLSWDGGQGAVVLRTLPSPTEPATRLLAIQTSRWRGNGPDDLWHAAAWRLAAALRRGGSS
jgi:uncharacterized protein YndB with AHSA1/START domain